MDNQNIMYLVIALVMIFVAIYILVKSFRGKQDNATLSQSHQPSDKRIVPRDQRAALTKTSGKPLPVNASTVSMVESQGTYDMEIGMPATTHSTQSDNNLTGNDTVGVSAAKSHVDQLGDTLSSLEHATADIMPVVESGEATDYEGSSSLLDSHLQQQELLDQNSALRNAAEVVSLTLLPINQLMNFDGDTVLQILDAYGLKFGEMNMFHRYEESDGTGSLLFSVMRHSEKEGTLPFDLQTLSDETVDGLTFFLPLPHPKASAGIGAMISMAGSMARDINATVYNESFEPLDRHQRDALREYVTGYK